MYSPLLSDPEQKDVVMKERSAGLYRLSAYYLSAITAELLNTAALPVIDVNIMYWMAGLEPDAGIFLSILLIVILMDMVVQVSNCQ